MAKKKDQSDVTLWRNRISHAESVRKDFDSRYGYTRALKEYRGQYKEVMNQMSVSFSDVPLVPINEVKAFVRTFLPSIYSRDPIINVNPQGRRSVLSAKVAEKAINALWRELKIKREVRKCIVDACLTPFGWIKVGYSAVFGNHEIEEGNPQFESNQFIADEELFAVRESWTRIVYDPDAIDPPYDCRWMAHKIIKPLKAVKESNVYENTEDLEGSTISSQEYTDTNGKTKTFEDEPNVILWEIWDKDSMKVITIAEGCDKPLLERPWPYQMKGFPFIGLTFDVNPDENYPQNYISSWEPQLWEKIKMRSMTLDHIKRFGRQLACEEGAMSKENMAKFELGKTGSVIQYKKGKVPPVPIQYPPIQSDMYAVMNAIEYDKDNISGQAAAMRGAPQKTQSRTIGEINQIVASGEGRNADPQDLVEQFSEDIASALLSLAKEFITLPKFVKITQKEAPEIIAALGKERFDGTGFEFTKDDIQGNYEIDIKAGSTLPLNRQNRIQIATQVLKQAPALGIMPGGKVATTIGKNLLSDLEMYEVEQAYEEELAEIAAQKQAQAQLATITGAAVGNGVPLSGGGETRGRPPKQGVQR